MDYSCRTQQARMKHHSFRLSLSHKAGKAPRSFWPPRQARDENELHARRMQHIPGRSTDLSPSD